MSKSRIVVGVDESAGARAAFDWAAEQASLHGATLVPVRAYQVMSGSLPHASVEEPFSKDLLAGSEHEAKQAAETFLEGLATHVPDGVTVEPVVTRGRPAHELLRQAENADMLVVGSRGRGGFAGLLLGSVSQQVVQHAPCPVVVIPPPAADRGA